MPTIITYGVGKKSPIHPDIGDFPFAPEDKDIALVMINILAYFALFPQPRNPFITSILLPSVK
jgi:hypothetical protein